MRIVALVKQILDPRGITVRRDKERIFVNREEYLLGPGSSAAIEAALRLQSDQDTVIAISMGQPRADDALREALAMGCDAAYLLCDDAFEEADISVTTRVLAAAVEEVGGADLIVAGRESGDMGAGQLGPRLAEALGFAQVTDVYSLAMVNGTLETTRRWGSSYAAVRAQLPVVATVAPEAFTPRLAHGARIMSAYRDWEVPVLSAADLRLTEAALTPLLVPRGESFPPPLEEGEEFRGEPSSVARELVLALRLQKLVRPAGGRSYGL